MSDFYEMEVPRDLRACKEAHRNLEAHLAHLGVPEGELFDVMVILSEVTSNALKYGKGDTIRIRCGHCLAHSRNQVSLSFIYHTDEFDTAPPPPDPLAEGGRGLLLIRALSENTFFTFARDERGHSLIAITAVVARAATA